MPVTRLARPCILFAAVAFLLSLCTPSSEALGRGGSSAMRAYMRMAQAQAKWMQAYQKQQKEQYDAFMKRFDTNRNGKIDGKEKGPAQRYMRQIELGKDPDKAIKTLGGTSSSSAR